jgi:cyclic pyranopterin phosphate synthase
MTTEKIIPLADIRYASRVPHIPARVTAPTGLLSDTRGRPLRDLRISVTDRCNFRCSYCMPREVFDKDYAFLPQSSLLSFEEITRLAKIFVAHGVEKIRLTGGEPLLRKHLEVLVEMLAKLQTPHGKPLDITLTTNASLLAKKAQSLKDAGLQRVTVSLDALDDATFRRMNDVDFPVADVLKGIEAAQKVGLAPLKVNMVVKRGTNDAEILPMARHFRHTGTVLRFIEYMDVGTCNGWDRARVVPSAELRDRLHARWPLRALAPGYRGEVATRYAFEDGAGEIGFVSSVSAPFCGDCHRARVSADGRLYTCLFAGEGHDLRAAAAAGEDALAARVAELWRGRGDRYSELRGAATAAPARKRVEMYLVGG